MIRITKLHKVHLFLSQIRLFRFLYNRYREIKIFLRDYTGYDKNGGIFLIYMADGKILHGGLADRLYGIMNGFAIAKIKNIPFKINFIFSFNLSLFFVFNKYDWSIGKEEISYSKKYSRIMIRMQETGWYKKISDNKQIHFYCNTNCLDEINQYYNRNFTYSELFHELFKPSEQLQIKIDNIINNFLNKNYVGIHFRFKNSLGDFKEITYQPLSKEKKSELLELCYRVIMSKIESGKKVFLTSDSQFFLETINERTKEIFYVPGGTKIMDFEAPLSVHEKSFLDFYILGSANEIMSFYGQGLYKSGFSHFASQIFNADFSLVDIGTVNV